MTVKNSWQNASPNRKSESLCKHGSTFSIMLKFLQSSHVHIYRWPFIRYIQAKSSNQVVVTYPTRFTLIFLWRGDSPSVELQESKRWLLVPPHGAVKSGALLKQAHREARSKCDLLVFSFWLHLLHLWLELLSKQTFEQEGSRHNEPPWRWKNEGLKHIHKRDNEIVEKGGQAKTSSAIHASLTIGAICDNRKLKSRALANLREGHYIQFITSIKRDSLLYSKFSHFIHVCLSTAEHKRWCFVTKEHCPSFVFALKKVFPVIGNNMFSMWNINCQYSNYAI